MPFVSKKKLYKAIEEAKKLYHPGAVMEAIVAQANDYKGERVCAGMGTLHARRISDGAYVAGYLAEYLFNGDEKEAQSSLHAYLLDEFGRLYNTKEYEYYDEKFCIQEHTIQHNLGTAIAAIGFVSYIYPVFGKL